MRIISMIIAIFGVWICINVLVSSWLDKQTKFRRELSNERFKVVFMFMLFSIPMIPFIKQLRNYRKEIYFNDKMNRLLQEKRMWGADYDIFVDRKVDWDECDNYFRYKKTKKITNKK